MDSLTKSLRHFLYIHPSLELKTEYCNTRTDLPPAIKTIIIEEALVALHDLDPLLAHILIIKVVRNERKNLINIRLKNEYMRIIHFYTKAEVIYCFSPVLSLEPYVRAFAIHRHTGELKYLNDDQRVGLILAVKDFIQISGLTEEKYSTSLQPPEEYRSLGEVLALQSSAQLFSLYLRIASTMYRRKMPLLAVLPYEKIRPLLASLSLMDSLTPLIQCCPYLHPLLRTVYNGSPARLGVELSNALVY